MFICIYANVFLSLYALLFRFVYLLFFFFSNNQINTTHTLFKYLEILIINIGNKDMCVCVLDDNIDKMKIYLIYIYLDAIVFLSFFLFSSSTFEVN